MKITNGQVKLNQKLNDFKDARKLMITRNKALGGKQNRAHFDDLIKLYSDFPEEFLLPTIQTANKNKGKNGTIPLLIPGFNKTDLCIILDKLSYAELRKGSKGKPDTLSDLDNRELQTYAIYPVVLAISPKASENDVIDYVKKRWTAIRFKLDKYGKQPRIRNRPKQERNNFIWEKRKLPINDLLDLVNSKFPDADKPLGYENVNATIRHESKRRNNN